MKRSSTLLAQAIGFIESGANSGVGGSVLVYRDECRALLRELERLRNIEEKAKAKNA